MLRLGLNLPSTPSKFGLSNNLRGSVGTSGVTFPFTDDFNRADQTLTDSPNWTLLSGTAANVYISTNALTVNDATSDGTAVAAPDIGQSNMFVEFNVGDVSLPTGPFVTIIMADNQNYLGIRSGNNVSNGAIEIFTKYANTFGLVYSNPGAGLVTGDKLRLNLIGTAWEMFVNDVSTSSGTISSSVVTMGNTKAGVVARNHLVQPFIDNFSCGPL